MGADAEILVFGYDRYRRTVVPRLIELIGGAGPTPWFEDVCRRLGVYFEDEWRILAGALRQRPTDLARHCTWLGADLRHLGQPPVSRDAWLRLGRGTETRRLMAELRAVVHGVRPAPAETGLEAGRWEQIRCSSGACPERFHCLLHERAGPPAPEMLYWLFEALAMDCCIGERRFVGRNATPDDFRPVLRDLGVPPGDRLAELFDALGSRGAALGHTGAGADGIHGWLIPAEAADLATRLDRLDLPVVAPTDDAMSEAHRATSRGAGFSWPRLTLSFVRIMAHRAAAGGHGLLFGHDVSAG